MPEINEPVEQPIILEYQHTDEKGQPLLNTEGRPIVTNFTGKTKDELIEKLKDAHINVTRAFHRSQKFKAVPKQPEPPKVQLTPDQEAARKMAGTDKLERDVEELRAAKDAADANKASYQFMSSHFNDYYPCQANGAVMAQYINENGLDPKVVDNYEIAFAAVSAKLAQRPAPPTPPITPQPEPEPPAPRRQAAGGLQPGQLSGQRPEIRKKGPFSYTKKEIKDMPRAEYHKLLQKPGFEDYVNSLYSQS